MYRRTLYHRQYKHNTKGRRCPCGSPAIKWKAGWICAACEALELQMYGGHGAKHSGYDFAMAGAYNPLAKYYSIFCLNAQ